MLFIFRNVYFEFIFIVTMTDRAPSAMCEIIKCVSSALGRADSKEFGTN